MTIKQVMETLDAELLTPEADLTREVHAACGSDMMSDALAYADSHTLLLTGLCTLQVLRTVEMLDIPVIVFVRGKMPSEDMLELAAETERIVTLNDGMIVSDSRKTEKDCDLSEHHKMNEGYNKPEIGEEGMIC